MAGKNFFEVRPNITHSSKASKSLKAGLSASRTVQTNARQPDKKLHDRDPVVQVAAILIATVAVHSSLTMGTAGTKLTEETIIGHLLPYHINILR